MLARTRAACAHDCRVVAEAGMCRATDVTGDACDVAFLDDRELESSDICERDSKEKH